MDEPQGTYACPICGRDYPHSKVLHDADRNSLDALLREGERALRHMARMHEASGNLDACNDAVWARRMTAARQVIQKNASDKLSAGLIDICSS